MWVPTVYWEVDDVIKGSQVLPGKSKRLEAMRSADRVIDTLPNVWRSLATVHRDDVWWERWGSGEWSVALPPTPLIY